MDYQNEMEAHKNLFIRLNQEAKKEILDSENFDWIAKALTHYLFRNGPVENMHANHQLSQEDMKTLNKFMVNRIAGLLKLLSEGEWLKIQLMLESLRYWGSEWDEAEFDTEIIEYIFENRMREKNKTQESVKN